MTNDKIQKGSIIESRSGKLYVVHAVYGEVRGKGHRLGVYRWENGKKVGAHRNLYSGAVRVVEPAA